MGKGADVWLNSRRPEGVVMAMPLFLKSSLRLRVTKNELRN